jgi:hypothetical protein
MSLAASTDARNGDSKSPTRKAAASPARGQVSPKSPAPPGSPGSAAKPPKHAEEEFEFGGTLGAVLLIIWSHAQLYYFWYCMTHNGTFARLADCARARMRVRGSGHANAARARGGGPLVARTGQDHTRQCGESSGAGTGARASAREMRCAPARVRCHARTTWRTQHACQRHMPANGSGGAECAHVRLSQRWTASARRMRARASPPRAGLASRAGCAVRTCLLRAMRVRAYGCRARAREGEGKGLGAASTSRPIVR